MRNLLITLLFASQLATAQELLSLEDAIQIGLDNNYGIKIARIEEQIAETANNPGNAGFLPSVNVGGNLNYNSANTRQVFFSGDERSGKGAGTTQARTGGTITWTAFDGFRMFATRDRLDLLETRSRTFTQNAMQNLVTEIQSAYYGMARIKQQIEIVQQSIQLNESLLDLAEAKLKIGTGTSLDVLQTSNSLNADRSTLLNLIDQFQQAGIGLNRLIGRDPAIEFDVESILPEPVLPQLEILKNAAIQQNYTLSLLLIDEQIALTQIKEVRSALYPRLDLNLGLNYNYSRAEVGFLLSNRTFGPTGGITMSYDLFPGRNIKKDIQVSELMKDNVQLRKQDLLLEIESRIIALYQQYQSLDRLLELEKNNVITAEKNSALASELYRSGRATSLDVREAILSETRVRDRLSEVQFRQKITEINIKNLTGMVFM
jgi:outer membrane protein